MHPRYYLIFLTTFGLTSITGASEPTGKSYVERISRLIRQLGSEQYQERESACRELEVFGDKALDPLQQACKSDDEEVRHRAEELLKQIKRRSEARQILAPSRVRLTYTNTPLNDAVADINKKTGFNLTLIGDKERLGVRRITLDTGETSFWDALAQFCSKAQLTENSEDSLQVEDRRATRQIMLRQQIMVMRGRTYQSGDTLGQSVTLREGKFERFPSCDSNAVRVRVLPEQARLVVHSAVKRDVSYTLELTPEPKLKVINLMAPRVIRVEDDLGLALSSVPATLESAPNNYDAILMGGAWGNDPFTAPGQDQRHVSLQLRLREPATTRIVTLRGTILAQIQAPPGPLVVAEDILKASDKTFIGEDGNSLKVIEARKVDNQLQLRVLVNAGGGMGGMNGMNGIFFAQQQMAMEIPVVNEAATGLSLFDSKGQQIKAGNVAYASSPVAKARGMVNEYKLTYPLNDGKEPTRLVFSGPRVVVVEVPFELKDVPLPKR